MNKLRKLIARLRSYKNYHDYIKRRVKVENKLWLVVSGKHPPLGPEDCRELALILGVPEKYRIKK